MNNCGFVLRPISATDADALRLRGGPLHIADAYPGYPCRECLHDAAIGDELILVSHDPFVTKSKYRSASPIFLHRRSCQQIALGPELPEQLTCRQLSVRSFDNDETMIDAVLIEGHDLEATIQRFFSDERSSRIHVHNATRGCWAVAIDRATEL